MGGVFLFSEFIARSLPERIYCQNTQGPERASVRGSPVRRLPTIMTTTPITVTRLDLQRLERMLDSLDEYGPAAEALEAELARATVVGHDEIPPGVVTMNSTVRCREESSGKEYHLTLVYPADVGGEGKVSILAPVGTALLGLTTGQSIDWPAPSGKTLKLTLLEVEYQPEAAGDFDR